MKWLPSTAARSVAGFTLLAVLWWLFALSARPLMLPDEGRYVGVAWEMLRSGDWLTPTLNGLPYFHKPPLFYWITASTLGLFGPHEWAARSASVVGALLGAIALFSFVARWSGERVARAALVVLLAQPLWLVAAQFANLDMLVAGCITATIVLLAHSVLLADDDKPWHRVLAAAWALAALGVLAKGLIGFVLPSAVIFVWLVMQRKWRSMLRLFWWPGMLIFVAITAPWFLAMQQRFPDFLNYFFVVQHFKRFTESGFNNAMPFWFFPAILLVCFSPWLAWLIGARGSTPSASPSHRSLRLLMLIWAMVVVVFFSLPQSKLLGYVLPAVPPLAFLVADAFVARTTIPTRSAWAWRIATGIGCALSLCILTWLVVHPEKSSEMLAAALREDRRPSELVVMLDKYYFDLPFYARLSAPVVVVDHWDDPAIHQKDNERKELVDAAGFSASAATGRLVLPADLPALLCSSSTTWLIGPSSALQRYAFLGGATEVQHEGENTLWRMDSRPSPASKALGCGRESGNYSSSSQP